VERRSPHDREILRLALPAFGALVAEPLYILADTAVVGHLGTAPLGGLAVASSILLTGYAIFIFLAYGTTAAVARLIGAGDEREAAHQAVQSLWLALAISAVLVVLGLVFAAPLVDLLGATGDVRDAAVLYLRVSLLGVPALLVVLAGTGYLRGLQDTRTPLAVAIGSNVLNLGLEILLIPILGFGVGASALATVFAQTVAAAVYVAQIVRAVRAQGVDIRPHGRSIARLARVGGDLLVRTVALRGALTLATAVAARLGEVEVAAQAIAFAIWSLLALGLDAIAIAGQALVGRYLGAGDATVARDASARMIEWGVVAGVVAGVAVVILRPVLPIVFTHDEAVRSLVAFILWFVAAMQPVNGVVFVLDGVLIGAGDMRFLAVAMVVNAAVFAVAAAIVLATGAGMGWLWVAISIFMIARGVTLGARFRRPAWAIVGAEAPRA
jgi:putative MATE family efflux protein